MGFRGADRGGGPPPPPPPPPQTYRTQQHVQSENASDTVRSSQLSLMKFQGSVKSEPHEKPAVATTSSVEESSSSAAATVVSSEAAASSSSSPEYVSPEPSSSPPSAVARAVSAVSQGTRRRGGCLSGTHRCGGLVHALTRGCRDSLAVAGPRRGGSEGPSGLLGAASAPAESSPSSPYELSSASSL